MKNIETLYTTFQICTSRSESELFMTEENMLSWATYVNNIETFGLMILPWQRGLLMEKIITTKIL